MGKRPAGGDPTTHTVVIGSAGQAWKKLAWDIDMFGEIQRGYPVDPEPLGFAALNVCISACSLADWTWTEHARALRGEGVRITERAFRDSLRAAVRDQPMCEAIANTTKHADLRHGEWSTGRVDIVWWPATDAEPGTYMLRHSDVAGPIAGGMGLNVFTRLESDWLRFLQTLGMSEASHSLDTEWRQRKLNELFGPR